MPEEKKVKTVPYIAVHKSFGFYVADKKYDFTCGDITEVDECHCIHADSYVPDILRKCDAEDVKAVKAKKAALQKKLEAQEKAAAAAAKKADVGMK